MSPVGLALLDIEPELAADIPAEDLLLARRLTVVPRVDLEPGPWDPMDVARHGERVFALLVVDGLVTRSISIADRVATQLLGPGDVLPIDNVPERLVPARVRWTANAPTRVALLDDRVLAAGRRWPGITRELYGRVAGQGTRQAVHAAIAQQPRVDTRVLAILWHLAERFGRVTSAGVVVPIHLTHEALGRLVGAQRPTVTLAVRDLTDSGALERRSDGSWLLHAESQGRLAPSTEHSGSGPALLRLRGTPGPAHVPEPRAAPSFAVEPLQQRLEALRRVHERRIDDVDRRLSSSRSVRATSRRLRERIAAERAGGAAA